MSPETEDRGNRPTGDSIGRNAMFGLVTQLGTGVFTAVLTLYLVRVLGPSGYGTLALGLGITGLLLKPSDIGTTQSAARYVAEHHGDTAGVTGLLGMALPMRLLTATLISIALFLLAGPIADTYDTPELEWPLRALAVAFFGQSVFRFTRVMFVAMRRGSRAFALVLSESAVEFVATLSLVLLGGGVTGAACGRAAGYVFGAILGVIMLGRLLGRSPLRRTGPSPVRRREFLNYAGAMLIVVGAGALFSQINVLVIGALLSTSAVGMWSAPMRLTSLLALPAMALSQGVAPRMARHRHDAPASAAQQLAIRYMLMFQGGLAAYMLLWADPITNLLLGSEYTESAQVLRALASFIFLGGISPLVVSPLNYAGEGKRRIPISIAALVLNGAIAIVLIPEIGILGAAVGLNVAYAVYVGWHLWLAHRLLDLSLRPMALSGLRSLLAGGVTAIILALIDTSDLSVGEWLAGVLGGGCAYLVVLVATAEVSTRELREIPAMVLRALRPG